MATVVQLMETLKEAGAMDNTIIVAAPADEAAPIKYMAPYAGTAMAEYFTYKGGHSLCIYDDLTKHAYAYRQMSLLLRRPPGREAYPGDVFYLHSRLLERGVKLSDDLGGGSLTALPIIETQASDVSAYIPTNVISITDGQIFLESDLFYSGVRPAINVGISVSRVGGNAQTKAMKKVAGKLRLDLSQYRELEAFAQFGSELDPETQKTLSRGERLVEALNQGERQPLSVADQVASIYAGTGGYLDRIKVERVPEFLDDLRDRLRTEQADLVDSINDDGQLSDEQEEELGDAIAEMIDDFGPDFDAEGNELEEGESDRIRSEEERSAPGRDGRRRGGRGRRPDRRRGRGGDRLGDHGYRRRTSRTGSPPSRTSARSRGRWRWWPLRGCAGPSSGSTRCGPTRRRSAGSPSRSPRPPGRPATGSRCSQQREDVKRVGIILVTGDRGLAGSFNTQIIRAGTQLQRELEAEGKEVAYYVVGRRGNSALSFRGESVEASFTGFTDQPAFANAREIGDRLAASYVDEEIDRVELIYNRYVSPLTQYVRRQTLLPLQEAEVFGEGVPEPEKPEDPRARRGAPARRVDLRAGARGGAAGAVRGVREPVGLPGAARVGRLRARRADDGDAQRRRERRRHDRRPDPGDEPGPPGRDHAGDPRGRRRRRGARHRADD